ncbi:hypothetical protein [Microcystis sp. BLCC-F210]|uniref:hypothetical protein n=1 Tax=Microcystis sp. BLCC-F210 TaxID=3342751 RepID=UPI0035C92730
MTTMHSWQRIKPPSLLPNHHRAIMRLLEDVLAEEILSGRVSDGDTAMVDIDEEGKVKVISGERRELIAPVIE